MLGSRRHNEVTTRTALPMLANPLLRDQDVASALETEGEEDARQAAIEGRCASVAGTHAPRSFVSYLTELQSQLVSPRLEGTDKNDEHNVAPRSSCGGSDRVGSDVAADTSGTPNSGATPLLAPVPRTRRGSSCPLWF